MISPCDHLSKNAKIFACASAFFSATVVSHTHVGAPQHANTWNDVDGPFEGLDSLIDIGWKGYRGHVGLVVCQRNYTQTLALATFMRSCSHLPRGFGLLCAQQLLDDVRTKFFLDKEAWARQRLRRGPQAISTLSFMNSASNPQSVFGPSEQFHADTSESTPSLFLRITTERHFLRRSGALPSKLTC